MLSKKVKTKAIKKLENVNDYIKNTSLEIEKLYNEYDKYARIWNELSPLNVSNDILDVMNEKIKKANELIKKTNIKDIKEANKIIASLIKEAKSYKK